MHVNEVFFANYGKTGVVYNSTPTHRVFLKIADHARNY
jgi:hypothetical protein